MTELAHRIDPQAKGWPEVAARLKAKHPTARGLLEGYRGEVLRARAFLVAHDVVPFPPDDVLDVIDTPQFQRTTITAAYDAPPPFAKFIHIFTRGTSAPATCALRRARRNALRSTTGTLASRATTMSGLA